MKGGVGFLEILIVDDQIKILEAIKKLIHWEELKISKVHTANNAVAARKIIVSEKIAIVLTDIEMPGESGISFHQWLSKSHPDICCIFLSSHAEFTYAQEALHNGAFDYILQPASLEQIEEVIGRCVQHIIKRDEVRNKIKRFDTYKEGMLESHVFAMFHQKEQYSELENWITVSKADGENYWYLPCLLEFEDLDVNQINVKTLIEMLINDYEEELQYVNKSITCVSSVLNKKEVAILLFSSEKKLMVDQWIERFERFRTRICNEHGDKMKIFIGKYAKKDLPACIQSIYRYKKERVLNQNKVYFVEEVQVNGFRDPEGAVWGRWIIRRDYSLLKNQIANRLRYAEEEQLLTVDYMQKIVQAFLEACTIACYESNRTLSELFTSDLTYEQVLGPYTSTAKLLATIDCCLRNYSLLDKDHSSDGENTASERVREIIRYLEENMERMISRREAAKYVFLNEDYFSRIFRKETGLGYKEYVLKSKMDYASKLLKDTDMPVAVIASKVGYDNYSNFTICIKR